MNKLSDLELCKKIAEIEGYESDHIDITIGVIWVLDGHAASEFNPLTDDALCFQLMVKYKIQFMPSKFTPRCDGRKQFGAVSDDLILRSNNPNKAICLAIVEANNG